jgi:phosphatidylserine/phosphatidylglycerophosphate/cardiolipin synthase-like enzyme
MSNKPSRSNRSLISAILGVLVIIIAAIASFLDSGPAPTPPPTSGTSIADVSEGVLAIPVQQGFGAQSRFWQVFFTAPTGSRDPATYVGGIDGPLASAINAASGRIDIAAFEFNNRVLTQALLAAHARGVQVRMVTDDEHGLHDEDSTIPRLIEAGIPVVDDNRSALMHNKFVIIDGSTIWTGSMNFTVNGTYRNNNNLLALRSRRAVESYQAEFNEMFEQGQFGPRSPEGNSASFRQDGVPIRTLFAAEDDVLSVILEEIRAANTAVRFMAFSFTVDEIADAIQDRAANGAVVQGIFETVGSQTRFSELTRLWCAGLQVRQDGNPFILHHKVFIIDDDTVLTGSFNFSDNATRSNDENMVIIQDRDLTAQYLAEFQRRWAEAKTPTNLSCS